MLGMQMCEHVFCQLRWRMNYIVTVETQEALFLSQTTCTWPHCMRDHHVVSNTPQTIDDCDKKNNNNKKKISTLLEMHWLRIDYVTANNIINSDTKQSWNTMDCCSASSMISQSLPMYIYLAIDVLCHWRALSCTLPLYLTPRHVTSRGPDNKQNKIVCGVVVSWCSLPDNYPSRRLSSTPYSNWLN